MEYVNEFAQEDEDEDEGCANGIAIPSNTHTEDGR